MSTNGTLMIIENLVFVSNLFVKIRREALLIRLLSMLTKACSERMAIAFRLRGRQHTPSISKTSESGKFIGTCAYQGNLP